LYDVDDDGFITKEEMVSIVQAIYEMLGSQPETQGGEHDDNNEKVISQEDEENDPVKRVDLIFQQLDTVIVELLKTYFYFDIPLLCFSSPE